MLTAVVALVDEMDGFYFFWPFCMAWISYKRMYYFYVFILAKEYFLVEIYFY